MNNHEEFILGKKEDVVARELRNRQEALRTFSPPGHHRNSDHSGRCSSAPEKNVGVRINGGESCFTLMTIFH